ncbi:hypothetical protein ILYODFUR_035907 [Ilyodon furcidens]|uniref:Uncharacterized protein n=1 Tax=Ilyodon furcidens TaxID=33524 RepID=A0ABV0UY34_9TELE
MSLCLEEASRSDVLPPAGPTYPFSLIQKMPEEFRQTVFIPQICSEVLEALRSGQLGEGQQKAAETYRATCHKIYPYCLAFMPPGYQDNSTAISTNGDLSAGEHDDLAHEM